MNTVIKFAGHDPRETDDGYRRVQKSAKSRQIYARAMRAYTLFSHGKDTAQIAEIIGRKESTVLRWVTQIRCIKRGLPSAYERRA